MRWKKNPVWQLCSRAREQSLHIGTGKMVPWSHINKCCATCYLLYLFIMVWYIPVLPFDMEAHCRWKWVSGDLQLHKSCMKLLWTSYRPTHLLFWMSSVVHRSIHWSPAPVSKSIVKDPSARNPADLVVSVRRESDNEMLRINLWRQIFKCI